MLKFGGRTEKGEAIVGLVLSRDNVARLQGGEPVLVRGEDVGAPGVVIILHVTDQPNDDLALMQESVLRGGGNVRALEDVLEEPLSPVVVPPAADSPAPTVPLGPWVAGENGGRAPCGCEWSVGNGVLFVVPCGDRHENEMARRGRDEAEGRGLALSFRPPEQYH